MNQLNSIILEGNIVRENTLREPTPGFKVYQIPLAVNRFYKGANGETSEEVSYFDVDCYGRLAEVCKEQCKKGRGVRVVGRIKQDRWEKDGRKESKVVVVAEHIEFKPVFVASNTDSEAKVIQQTEQAAAAAPVTVEAAAC
ncbi:MAG: single-stranded DNA-binding protein [Treponema sp.]|nr:single-stranded DNA-binding protein [Treponema sp.]